MAFYLFIVSCFLTVWHYLYESTIAPSFRAYARNKLFRLRDDLRRALILRKVPPKDDDAFKYVQGGINRVINRLEHLTFLEFRSAAREMLNDKKLNDRIKKRLDLLDRCHNEEILRIWRQTNGLAILAMVINLGAWIVYIIPVLLGYLFLRRIRLYMSNILLAPPYAEKKYLPDHSSELMPVVRLDVSNNSFA